MSNAEEKENKLAAERMEEEGEIKKKKRKRAEPEVESEDAEAELGKVPVRRVVKKKREPEMTAEQKKAEEKKIEYRQRKRKSERERVKRKEEAARKQRKAIQLYQTLSPTVCQFLERYFDTLFVVADAECEEDVEYETEKQSTLLFGQNGALSFGSASFAPPPTSAPPAQRTRKKAKKIIETLDQDSMEIQADLHNKLFFTKKRERDKRERRKAAEQEKGAEKKAEQKEQKTKAGQKEESEELGLIYGTVGEDREFVTKFWNCVRTAARVGPQVLVVDIRQSRKRIESLVWQAQQSFHFIGYSALLFVSAASPNHSLFVAVPVDDDESLEKLQGFKLQKREDLSIISLLRLLFDLRKRKK